MGKMKQLSLGVLAVGAVLAIVATSALSQPVAAPDLPTWLYPPPPVVAPPAGPPDTSLRHAPGSSLGFTISQLTDRFGPADWHPDDHLPAPDIVAHGQKPDIWACGFCHLMNGQGSSDNAPLAGLDVNYFTRTMGDFKSGARKGADPHGPSRMAQIAATMSDDQVAAAAQYFAAVKYQPLVQVKEVDVAPVYHLVGAVLTATGQTAPLGQQILEVPADPQRAALRDDESGFIAYVPTGSIATGQALATGQGGVRACGGCHGADLGGTQRAPALAGRSPTYLLRQLYNFKVGARGGQMARIAGPLSLDQMIALAAYTGSLKP
jgi:cytochrome c553